MRCVFWVGALALACGPVSAQQDHLDARRNLVNQEADSAMRLCHESFAVTDCVKKAQLQQRRQLSEIKREETALHDQQRKEQAADQARQTAGKQARREQQQQADRLGGESDADNRKVQQDDKRHLRQDIATAGRRASNEGARLGAPHATESYRSAWKLKQQDAQKKRLDRDLRLKDRGKSKPVSGLPTTPP